MIYKVYPLLSTCSRRAMKRATKKFGHEVEYRPRMKLIKRLMHELSMSEAAVLEQIQKEREDLLKHHL